MAFTACDAAEPAQVISPEQWGWIKNTSCLALWLCPYMWKSHVLNSGVNTFYEYVAKPLHLPHIHIKKKTEANMQINQPKCIKLKNK